MTQLQRAERKRELRAKRRLAAALAGGWGRRAQIAAWDAAMPGWRGALDMVCDSNRDGEAEAYHELSRRLNADGRFLAGPWYRLLMQNLHRKMDARPEGRVGGRWNGYPLERT